MSSEGPQQPILVAGLTQSKKLIKVGMASSAFIAKDADAKIINLVAELCRTHGVNYDMAKTKKELGTMCGIDVDCAVCVTLN
jgi:large subunit ribosomal protein L7A